MSRPQLSVPWLFLPDYAPELSGMEREALGLQSPEDAIILCAVRLDSEKDVIHLNLLAAVKLEDC